MINLLDNKPNQPFKFWVKNWDEINDNTRGIYNKDSQIKFRTSTLKSSFCDYNDAYIRVSGTITVTPQERDSPNNVNKEVVFKNCAPFTDCMSEINNTQIHNTKDIDELRQCMI